ncbi:type VI immunity family protein [Salmonella enterica]
MNDKIKSLLCADCITELMPKDDEGYELSSFVYYFNFFFPDGYRKEYRNKVIAVCEEYWALCGDKLKWMTNRNHRWKKVPEAYDLQQWSLTYPDSDWCWDMTFHSGRARYESSPYCINGVGNSTQTPHVTSYLYLCFPVTWFSENVEQHPVRLYLRWAEMLNARHGTSGIGIFPAYDMFKRGQSAGTVMTLSKYFPGVEVCDFLQSIPASKGTLSPNWLNLLDNEYLDELGGYDIILKNIKGSNAQLYKYNGGVIISASEEPQLCENGELLTVPEDYRIVSRMLKPIRSKQPFGFWGVDTEHSLEWRNRMN